MGYPIYKWCVTKGSVESLPMQKEQLNLTGAVLDFQVRDTLNEIVSCGGDSNGADPDTRIIIVDAPTADFIFYLSEMDTDDLIPGRTYKTDIRVTPASGHPFYLLGIEIDVIEAQTR